MRGSGIDRLTASAIVSDVAYGIRTVTGVAEATISAIQAREAELQAFEYFDAEQVRYQAQQLDTKEMKGPLHGVTVAVKDIISTNDMPTSLNTQRYKGLHTGVDAGCVDMLRGAGALIVGKSTTAEFAATNRGPQTLNPLDSKRTPGGSSTGSAVAVAAGFCAIGVGTQTGGSVVRPASYNGVFGWKPTWNAITSDGVRTLSPTSDTVGFFVREAGDLELIADLFELDPAPMPDRLEGLKVGICLTPNWRRAEKATQDAMKDATTCFRSAGATLREITLPDPFSRIQDAQATIMARELRTAYLNEVYNTPAIHRDFCDWVDKGRSIAPHAAREAYALADLCRALMDEIVTEYDIILAPSATGEAPVGTHYTGDSSLNSMWTLLQMPVVSVPGLVGPSKMPIGVSLVARRYNDRTAISIAKLLTPLLEDYKGSETRP
jgi:Asp-tRNA(Asn)/Glu-tRNA(Gln) amidotransferase A subunit family amidase